MRLIILLSIWVAIVSEHIQIHSKQTNLNNFAFRFNGQTNFIFEPVLAPNYVKATIELLTPNTAKGNIRMYLKRNTHQIVSYRDISQIEHLDFLLYPDKYFSLVFESSEQVICRVTITKYLHNPGITIFPKEQVPSLNKQLVALQGKLKTIMKDWNNISNNKITTYKLSIYNFVLTALRLLETIVIICVIITQIRWAQRLINSSRRLI